MKNNSAGGSYLLNAKLYIAMAVLVFAAVTPLVGSEIKFILNSFALLYISSFHTINHRSDRYVNISIFIILFFSLTILVFDFYQYIITGLFSALSIAVPIYFYLAYRASLKFSDLKLDVVLENIIFYISVVSIISYLLLWYGNLQNFATDYTYYDSRHLTVYFYNIMLNDAGIVYRNTGIASEPGLFQLLVNIGLFLSIQKKNNSPFRMFVYTLSVLLTLSTAGIIILILIYLHLIKKHLSIKSNIKYLYILLFLFFIFYSDLNYHIENKLFGSDSFEGRFNPILDTLNTLIEYPLGLGNVAFDQVYKTTGSAAYESFGMILSRYGVGMFISISALYGKLLIRNTVLFFIVVVTFFSQPIWLTPLFNILIINYASKKSKL